ncbi:hypothetical protein DAI22_01g010600 [Oryza sativa Japonica Group]|nr:hypothetical protein DAI22_01g010600 [Oryza sativa Japonica Group]KAF2948067.1 hypothetical protein DAI22_01g010600 [Oryza sativa Japonica Group]KAF2948068.1 hypothetical protein DAI22_01g010600 [Oryza sativa Japonica Group]
MSLLSTAPSTRVARSMRRLQFSLRPCETRAANPGPKRDAMPSRRIDRTRGDLLIRWLFSSLPPPCIDKGFSCKPLATDP